MRPRFRKYLPVFIIALLVQILAPIGACWASAVAASGPLSSPGICHSGGTAAGQPIDHSGQPGEHDHACTICCLASAGSLLDTPAPGSFQVPYPKLAPIAWQDQSLDLSAFRDCSHARARAPPSPS